MKDSRRGRRGNMIMEAALWIPIVLLLIVGMVQIGKITYVYYALKKNLYNAATYIAAQQGINFCDIAGDTTIQQALNMAFTGGSDGTAPSQFPSLTNDQISVTTECIDSSTQGVGQCSISGCDGAAGAQRPDFLVVSIPNGYQVSPRIPYMLIDPFLLKPQVRVPFGGT